MPNIRSVGVRIVRGDTVSELGYETSAAPAAGWYPDPADPSASRWWSGTAWTDHVQPAAVAAVPAAAVPVAVAAPAGPPVIAGPIVVAAPTASVATAPRSNLDSDGVPLSLFADSPFDQAVLTPAVKPTSQYEWHQQSGRGVVPKRQVGGSVSLSTALPSADANKHNPYRQRNWLAGAALLFALLSIPGLAAKVLVDLPPLSQSIFAGAPIAISLLALFMAFRRGTGLVLSIVALVISGAVLAAGLLVDPVTLKSVVDSVMALLP